MRVLAALLAVALTAACERGAGPSDDFVSAPTDNEPTTATTIPESGRADEDELFGHSSTGEAPPETRVLMPATFEGVASLVGRCVVLSRNDGVDSVLVMPRRSYAGDLQDRVLIDGVELALGRWTVNGGEIAPGLIGAYASPDGYPCAQIAKSFVVAWDGTDCCRLTD